MATRAIGRFCQRLAARDGVRRGLSPRVTKGECGAQKHECENRLHGVMSSLHQFVAPWRHYNAKPCQPERHVVSPEARAATQSENSWRPFSHEIAIRECRAPMSRFV